MNEEKYQRRISLNFPTCGSTQYEFSCGVDETIELAKCASCGRELTKDELLRENSENIHEHVQEISKMVKEDIAKELRESIRKALKGNKNFRIK